MILLCCYYYLEVFKIPQLLLSAGKGLKEFWSGKSSQVALVEKKLLANAGNIKDTGLIAGPGTSPGGEHDNPLQYYLENPMDRGAWKAAVHGITKSWT